MKHILDFDIISVNNRQWGSKYALITLKRSDGRAVTDVKPGQFVQVEMPDAKSSFLRRPISVCNVDDMGRLWLLVRDAGEVTHRLVNAEVGTKVNIVYPLGHGFSTSVHHGSRVLLVGGGVGIAPLYYYLRFLNSKGVRPSVLIGARTADDVLMRTYFNSLGELEVCTEDGSFGTRGLVTAGKWLSPEYVKNFDLIACCGPTPMMKAVAAIAREAGVPCEVSLENMMACGLGACLCCVEKMNDGHNVCVCTEGPVFNIDRLPW